MDEVSAELTAAHQGVGSVPRWRYFAARRALHYWEKVRERYEQTVREAYEAYQPISREIWHAVWAEHDRAGLRAREEAQEKREDDREEAQARRRATELAERPIWGWSVVTRKKWSIAYAFRHDVPHSDERVAAARQDRPCVNLPELRQALRDLNPDRLHWDDAALAKTGRELGAVSFALLAGAVRRGSRHLHVASAAFPANPAPHRPGQPEWRQRHQRHGRLWGLRRRVLTQAPDRSSGNRSHSSGRSPPHTPPDGSPGASPLLDRTLRQAGQDRILPRIGSRGGRLRGDV
ncbi:hypothetical protein [Streptomyces sp. NPDC005859]|uniref:hypothetical protein n=1 Tax=Streptomyces sp. NPDC005859 TaxID=3157170 RepID=UPI0033EF0E37